jgi:hypothetical protein
LTAPLLLVPAMALARAGGGQGYGGGGGGGGFGDDGGDGLWGLWPLLFLGHGSGFGGLVAFLVVLYVFKQLRRGGSFAAGRFSDILDGGPPPAPGMPAGQALDIPVRHYDQDQAAAGLAAIKAKDPNFDERAFLDRAQTTFFKIQQAWAARNQDLARDCMSDALYERHKMQTDQLIANHQIDVLENIVIGNAHLMSASAGSAFDSITVAFTASMTDYTVDEQTKKPVDGNQYRQTFTEFWTFIRRGDQKSTAGQTTLSPTCPSCGAPLTVTQGKCDYCGAYARTSSSDWVVDTIEQP